MIRRPGLKRMSTNAGPNMTPMVDIVMCILIFFMLSMEITGDDRYLTSNMAAEQGPSIGPAAGAELKAPPVTFRIEISADPVTHTATVLAFSQAITDLEKQLPALLEQKQPEFSPDVQVLIQARKDVQYQDIITVYDQCIRAQFKNVAFVMPTQ